MKKEFVEFLLKRLRRKGEDMAESGSADELYRYHDEFSEYLDTLQEVLTEVIKP